MTNINSTPEKHPRRTHLFALAERALEQKGYTVERIPRSGKSSLRRISKDGIDKTVSIRTTQDTWIAFPRTADDKAWATLEAADYVVASSVDDPKEPRVAKIHMLEGGEMRARFDRAYAARKAANYKMQVGRGIWLALYEREAANPVTLVGAGAGLAFPPIAEFPLARAPEAGVPEADVAQGAPHPVEAVAGAEAAEQVAPLTIAEAKRRLAATFGVREGDVSITING